MSGFEKIVLPVNSNNKGENQLMENSKSHPINKFTNKRVFNPGKKKILIIFLASIAFLLIFGFFFIFLPAQKTYRSAMDAYSEAKQAYDFAKKQDITKAGEKIRSTKGKVVILQKNLNGLSWTRFIPFVNGYYYDAKHFINAGVYSLDAAQILTDAITPYADILGLKGQGSFVLGSAEERIQKTVQAMDKVTPQIDEVAEKFNLVREEIDQIDPNRYPEIIIGKKIKSRIVFFKELVNQGSKAISDAKPVLKILPRLLGEPEAKKYLVLFQNDAELRPTGGFITAYAVFRLEHGKMSVEAADDIYKLDQTLTQKTPAPEPIKKYLGQTKDGIPFVPYWNLRDTNLSPDFKESMLAFEKIYQYSTEKKPVEGIIAIDTQVLAKTMDILGEIPAYGTVFSSKIIPECNCPQVIYELERIATTKTGYLREGRKDVIGVLMSAIIHKALASSPKQYWGPLFQTGIQLLNEKHILVYMHDENAQKGAEALNWGGIVQSYDGDYFHLNDTNFAGAKSNLFITETVDQKVDIGSDGTITKTVTINYKNPFAASVCDEHAKEVFCLNGLYRDWVRLYVPTGSKLIEVLGSQIKADPKEELGKTYFEARIDIYPQTTGKLIIKYVLPFKFQKGEYKLLIQKQPGKVGDEYTVNINGKNEKFNLTSDREIKF